MKSAPPTEPWRTIIGNRTFSRYYDSMGGCSTDSLAVAVGRKIECVLRELASDQNELAAELARGGGAGMEQGLSDAREVWQSLGRLQETLIASRS